MDSSDRNRLSVTLVELTDGSEAELTTLTARLAALLVSRNYGVADTIRDEARPSRFYFVRRWTDAAAAAACHADREIQELTARLRQIARVTHVVNGARPADTLQLILEDQRAGAETDRRAGFDRRAADLGRAEGERRSGRDRRLGPRRLQNRSGIDLRAAARAAFERARLVPAGARVAAAIETEDGRLVTGCSVEVPALGLRFCAEQVAVLKALSEGHRRVARLAIVSDTPTLPCEACRRLLSELGGNIEISVSGVDGPLVTGRLDELPQTGAWHGMPGTQ